MEIFTTILVATLIVGAGVAPQGFEWGDLPLLAALIGGISIVLLIIV
jgi:hypothetical protein